MKITVKEMVVRNFKGISNFELVLSGLYTDVRGDNGTGKTSLYDAFLWCLFGKNSQDQADTKFDWKPLDKDGQERHHLETFVNLELDIDGVAKAFSRSISEKWTKKRGSIKESFEGHTTTYHIDGLKVTQKDYKAAIEQLGGEQLFQMLTKVNYFAEVMKADDRRKILLEMAGDVSQEDVIAANKELASLPNILGGKTVEERTALVKQSMRQINQDIKQLPGRIDEAQRSLPDIEELDKQELATRKLALKADLARAQDELALAKSPAAMTDLIAKRAELKTKYANEEREYYQNENEKIADEIEEVEKEREDLRSEIQSLRADIYDLNEKIRHISDKKSSRNHLIKMLNEQNDELRDRFNKEKLKVFPDFDEHKLSCPVCGQQYDEAKLNEIKDNYAKEMAEFNKAKAERLASYKAKGNDNAAKIKECYEENLELDREESVLKETVEAHNLLRVAREHDLLDVDKKKNRLNDSIAPFHETGRAKELMAEYKELGLKIEALEQGERTGVIEAQAKIDEIIVQINKVNDDLYLFEAHAKQQARVDQLIDEEQRLGLTFGALEQQLLILEEYVRTKVGMLTDKINSKFQLVKFKLFDTAINGGLIECCEPTVNGANYSTGLNNAARINAGLDIIQALMEHYDLRLPLFVDNAESVNELYPIGTQLITLTVSDDKKMTQA